MKQVVKLVIFISIAANCIAQPSLPKIFGDHMVLQRNSPVNVWGRSKPKEKIIVTMNGQSKSTIADQNGEWKTTLLPMKEGGPYELVISGKSGKLKLNDVMIGEVWLCSGQSNMEWRLKSSDSVVEAITESAKYDIRQFEVPKKISLNPEVDLDSGEWKISSVDNVGEFTAVGYFFAREMAKKLKVTIGLINSTWGGSQAEGWISKEALLENPALGLQPNDFPRTWEEASKARETQMRKSLEDANGSLPAYQLNTLLHPHSDVFSKWPLGYAPGSWDWQHRFWSYRGNGFMMKEVYIPSWMAERTSVLKLAEYDGSSDVYINGAKIREATGNPNVSIPARTWKPGKNILLLKIGVQKNPDWYGVGIFGKAEDLKITFGNINVTLGGNGWRLMPSLEDSYHFVASQNSVASSIYNAMIAPIVPYTIRGAIWYQGESNVSRAYEYQTTFKSLIQDWRKQWNKEFPFYFVQLSSFGTTSYDNESDWAELREAQTLALTLPKTGMAVTIDIGNADDIHPTNKLDVGKRLSLLALNDIYGIPSVKSGPTYQSVDFKNGSGIVTFSSSEGGFMVRDDYGYIKGFQIAGSDHIFHQAKAEVMDHTRIRVWSDSVKQPVAIRYAWTNAPIDANLFNKANLPLGTFRTDRWPCITEKNKFKG
jgi:sialate O-acetylesterase